MRSSRAARKIRDVDTRPEIENPPAGAAQTLGDVLYARPGGALTPEGDWESLVRRTAAGELAALHGLYERAGRLVAPDEGAHTDQETDSVAYDAGSAGGGASAEELAIHETRPPHSV